MLVEHRVDDVDKGLVAIEQAVPPSQEIAFKPTLAQMLAQDFHYAAVSREMDVVRLDLFHPDPVGDVEHVTQTIRIRLVRTHQAEDPCFGVEPNDVPQET